MPTLTAPVTRARLELDITSAENELRAARIAYDRALLNGDAEAAASFRDSVERRLRVAHDRLQVHDVAARAARIALHAAEAVEADREAARLQPLAVEALEAEHARVARALHKVFDDAQRRAGGAVQAYATAAHKADTLNERTPVVDPAEAIWTRKPMFLPLMESLAAFLREAER